MFLITAFIISLACLSLVLLVKRVELARGNTGIFANLSIKYDHVIVVWFKDFVGWIQRIAIMVVKFVSKHLPGHQHDLYGKLKHFRDSHLEHFYYTMRGKQDLPKQKSSSLFLWHLNRKNRSKNDLHSPDK